MDETIGTKGGHNDYRKTLVITEKQKKKLKENEEEKEIKELENLVKKKQAFILIKTLPILLVGKTIKELTKIEKKNYKPKGIKPLTQKKEYKPIEIVEKNKKQIINITIHTSIDDIVYEKKPKDKNISIEEVKKDQKKTEKDNKPINIEIKQDKKINEEIKQDKKTNEEIKKVKIDKKETKEEKVKEVKQTNIIIPKTKEIKPSDIDINTLNERQKNKLQKLQSRKIIDVYEKQLKEIRYELRNLIFDYNALVDDNEKELKSSEVDKILDKLNQIIIKIEKLKNKIKIEDLDKYDDNYIYTLIEEYITDFKDKKVIKEIKDSQLYILISEKLEEIDHKKDKFKTYVETKKEKIKTDEDNLDKLREKYYKMENINKTLIEFQEEQELILKKMQEKVDNAVTVSEKQKVQIETMSQQTMILLRSLSLLMFLRGARGVKASILMAGIYSKYAKKALKPQKQTEKYKIVEVTDYSKSIEKNIEKITNIEEMLRKTTNDIDDIISKAKEEFKEYIGVIKEYDELLNNLEKIKSNIKEKEYEIKKIKEREEKTLEINNEKVLKRGEYKM